MARILLIDDDELGSSAIKRALEVIGKHTVTWKKDGEAGLIAARTDIPDLILLDILMPKMNGYEVLSELKAEQETLRIPVIMLTAVSDEQAMKETMLQYDADYIVKPVETQALLNTVDHALSCADKD